LREFAASADVGITRVDAALAETGSLVISSGKWKGRVVSLLSPVHIAFAPVSRLTTDIFTWLVTRQNPWPANTVLVSGPSKTADIEQTLAVGVHGPKRVIVILYRD
jgi:L-lactate utilization protein LutC